MTTRASLNGTGATALEFEASHYNNPYSNPEMESEWEWESHEASHYSNPYSNPEMEMEDEWESPEASHYNNPYSNPELEGEWEWESHEASHYSNPYSNPEMEEEWESPEASHYSNPYSNPEMEGEWESHEASHYSNPYSNPEMEGEWESPETSHYSNPYSNPEMEGEWESHEASHYSNPYSNPEGEADRFIPLLVKGAKLLLPHAKRLAMRVGRNLLSRSRQAGQRSSGRAASGRDAQIASLLRQLSNVLAQGESEAAAHEAELFGANEFETEVASHEMAHHAALTEVMAAEAAHTESESEAQALLGAALPLSIRVMGGRVALRRLTPTLVQVNARLVLSLHRQGRSGRQLLPVVPAIQRRTIATLKAIQRTGRPITPALATQVMAGQAMRVLGTPHICGRALVRNKVIRRQTVAPGSMASLQPRRRIAS